MTEWVIERANYYSKDAWSIRDDGFVYDHTQDTAFNFYTVRPAFYLKANVQLIGGTGTKEKPYRIS